MNDSQMGTFILGLLTRESLEGKGSTLGRMEKYMMGSGREV